MSRILRAIPLLLAIFLAIGAGGQALAQAGTGTVTIANYYCSYLSATTQIEAVDESQCAPGAGTFTFYLIGDGTADHETLNVDASGLGSITLPAGSYDMVVEATQTHMEFAVGDGSNIQLLIGNPSGDVAPGPTEPASATGTVTLQRFQCSYLDATLLVEAIDQAECSPLAATFSFYLYGDDTANYYQGFTGNDGMGTVELPVGSYNLVDEFSQTHFDMQVLEGQNVVMLIAGPQDAAPAPTPTSEAKQPGVATKLPNTGSGRDSGSGVAVVLMASGLAVVVGGMAGIRRMRENAA